MELTRLVLRLGDDSEKYFEVYVGENGTFMPAAIYHILVTAGDRSI